MSDFTPGPWQALPSPFEDRIEAVAHPGSCVASTGNWLTSEKAEQHANARLIAAAPDLLEALIQAFYTLVGVNLAHRVASSGWCWPDDAPETVSIVAETARAAIAKALRAPTASPADRQPQIPGNHNDR